jgi:predicted nucleic acid-binding protein
MLSGSFPSQVYLDSSYVIRLFSYLSDSTNAKNRACQRLYEILTAQKVQLVGSVTTFEETLFFFFFTLTLLPIAKTKHYQTVRDYRIGNPADFKSDYAKHSYKAIQVWQQFTNFGIALRSPHYLAPGKNASHRVAQYSVALLRKYDTLEPNDAIHIATARMLQLNYVITCDGGFRSVTELNVHCV